MKLIIEISEKSVNEIKDNVMFADDIPNDIRWDITKAIFNGKSLPKEHERLIILSEDVVKREQVPLSFSCQKWISEVGLSNATVAIVEADKADWLPKYEGKWVAESEKKDGHWITGRSTYFDVEVYRCSECKSWFAYKAEKCPNCHARMVKEKENKE